MEMFHTQNKGIKECNGWGYDCPLPEDEVVLFHTQNKGIKECN